MIQNGCLVVAYKTIAAIKFNGLADEIGVDANLIEVLNFPKYSEIKFKVKTKGSFNEPDFSLNYSLYERNGDKIFPKETRGHCLISDNGNEYFLTPSFQVVN